MPFPLPDGGPPYSEGLRWFLVAVPDDTAFVRAALGAYSEFTKYWVWGKEGKEPGRNEAAQVWENAVAATLEALEMGFPDILLGYIDQVEPLLRQILDRPCCGESPLDYLPNPNPGSGTIAPIGPEDEVPDLYDETDFIANPPLTPWTDADESGVVTLEEMEDYLCRAFNWYYDLLMRWLNYMKVYAQLGGLMWEPINAIITVVLSRYKGLPSWVTMTQEIADVLITLWPDITAAIADDLINAFQANRAEIICSLTGQTTMADIWTILSAQIETTLTALGYATFSSVVSWPTFALALASQGWIDLEGENNVCECAVDIVSYAFDTDSEGFLWYTYPALAPTGTDWWISDSGNPPGSVRAYDSTQIGISPIINAALHDTIRVTAQCSRGTYGTGRTPQVVLYDESLQQLALKSATSVSTPQFVTRVFNFAHSGSGPLRFGFKSAGGSILFDNIQIEFLETL